MTATTGAILVVDDDPDAVRGLQRIIRLDNYRVETAATAKQLLSRSNWSDYFAIILDRNLTDGTADELLPQLKQLAPQAAVIIVTGFSDLEGTLAALRHGAEDYLIKPINPEAIRATLRRIAERALAAKSLRESEQRFRLLIKSVKDYAIFMLDPAGYVVSWNEGAERIKGYREAEIIGQHFSCFYPSAVIQDGFPARELAFAAEQGSFEDEGWRVRKDGSQFWANVVITALRNNDGELYGFAKVTRDMTERKRAEEQLLQAERLSAIGEAMAGIAHESRNALNVAQSSLNIIERRAKHSPELKSVFEGGHNALLTIERLFEDVRQYAGPVVLEYQRCHLPALIDATWEALAPVRRRREALLRQSTAGLDAECDASYFKLGQVFRNLFENALTACEDPVEIEVCYREVELEGQPAVQVVVSDNGPGLTAEQHAHIFAAFYTTRTHGSGLGMAIARRIVEAHGGIIAVGPANRRGAQIIITLPRKKS